MNIRRSAIYFFFLSMVVVCAWGANPEEIEADVEGWNNALPFHPGEVLHYEIEWGIFHVADAWLSVTGPMQYDGQPAWRITLQVQTNGFADAIYPVRERTDSYVDLEVTRTLGYTQYKREGRRTKNYVVDVEWEKMPKDDFTGISSRTNFGQPDGGPVRLPPETHDPLSIVFGVRKRGFEAGEFFTVWTTNGKKLVETEILVHEEDEVKTPAGRFRAIYLEPETKDLGGVFEKSKDAGIEFWFSDDARRIPLVMKSKVVVGSFRAEFVRIESIDLRIPSLVEAPSEPDDDQLPTRRRGRGR